MYGYDNYKSRILQQNEHKRINYKRNSPNNLQIQYRHY